MSAAVHWGRGTRTKGFPGTATGNGTSTRLLLSLQLQRIWLGGLRERERCMWEGEGERREREECRGGRERGEGERVRESRMRDGSVYERG